MQCLLHSPKFQNQKGFTLIELLVVIAIIAIVVGGSIAGFVRFAERQEVYMTAKEVQQIFRLAKSKAQVQETPVECDGDPPGEPKLTAYRISVDASTVVMRPICEGTAISSANYPSVDLPTGVSVTPIGNFTYYTLGGGFLNSSGNPINDVTFNISKGSTSYQFTITGGGAISNVE